jgi:hypothetical protein
MKIHHCEQRSDEWYRLRMGIPTASQFHNILTPLGAPTKGDRRAKYKFRLIAERLLQQSMDDRFENDWTRRGKNLEGAARDAFVDQSRGCTGIETVGFVTTDDGKIGASPDGFLRGVTGRRSKEGLEIKCPSPWVQVEYLLQGLESNYRPQVQGHMLVTGMKKMHLWCYHPSMPPVHVPTDRDDDYIKKLARALFDFCSELDAETERARGKGPYKLAELLRLSAELGNDIPGAFPWH